MFRPSCWLGQVGAEVRTIPIPRSVGREELATWLFLPIPALQNMDTNVENPSGSTRWFQALGSRNAACTSSTIDY